jgi:ubiquitin C-terminal hydrolase
MVVQEVPPVYDLYAVSNHIGGIGGGHYTAFCKMPGTEKWYCFDDEKVRPIREDEVCSEKAYLIFYRRRDAVGREAGRDLVPLSPPAVYCVALTSEN